MGLRKTYDVSIYAGQNAPDSQTNVASSWVGPFTNNGYIYTVGGTRFATISPSHVTVAKTNTPDIDNSFVKLDTSNEPTLSSAYPNIASGMWVVQDGTVLHIMYYEDNAQSGGGIFYNTFNMSTDTWGTTEESAVDPSSDSLYTTVSCSIRSDGDIVMSYQGARESIMATSYDRTFIGRRESGSWTTAISVSGIGKVEIDEECGNTTRGDLTNNRMHLFYKQNTTGSLPIKYTTYLNDNSFGHQDTTVSTTASDAIVHKGFQGNGGSWNDGGTVRVRVPFGFGPLNLIIFGFDDADSPTASEIDAEIGDPFSADQTSGPPAFSYAIDVDAEQQIIIGVDNSAPSPLSGNYYFLTKTGVNNDIWMDEPDGTDFDRVGSSCAMVSANVFTRNGIKSLAWVAQQDQSGDFGFGAYWYNEHKLGQSLVAKFLPMKHIIVR